MAFTVLLKTELMFISNLLSHWNQSSFELISCHQSWCSDNPWYYASYVEFNTKWLGAWNSTCYVEFNIMWNSTYYVEFHAQTKYMPRVYCIKLLPAYLQSHFIFMLSQMNFTETKYLCKNISVPILWRAFKWSPIRFSLLDKSPTFSGICHLIPCVQNEWITETDECTRKRTLENE